MKGTNAGRCESAMIAITFCCHYSVLFLSSFMLQPFRLSFEEPRNLNARAESPASGLPLDAHLCSIRSRDRLMPRRGNLD